MQRIRCAVSQKIRGCLAAVSRCFAVCFAGLAEVSPRVKLVKEDVSQVSQGVSRWIHAVNLCNESVAPRSNGGSLLTS